MAKPQIIIVEDELIIAQEIKQFLLKMDYEVPATASYGDDALQKIAAIKPDLVLMDIKLKGAMNGIEAAGKAHALYDVPVVYMTANADHDTVERAKKTEAYGFVYKPVQPDVLRAVIEMALYKHNMEKQIKEREAWLGATLQSIGDAVIATDTLGKITFINGVAETLTGWKQAECKSMPLENIFNIINKKTRKPVINPVTRALQLGSQVGLANHTILIARDGTEYQISDSASPIQNSRNEIIGVVLVFRDVTKEYQMQEKIRDNEHKYRNLFDTSNSVIGVYEAVDNGDDFIIKDFNRAGEKIEKIKREEIIGVRLKQRYPDIVESGLFEVFQKVWKTGKSQQYLVTINRNNKIFNWRDTLVYKLQTGEIVAVYNDVTDRIWAEKKLQANEENLRITLDSIGDAVIATDTQGKITRMNPVAEGLTGWQFNAAKGKSLDSVFKIVNSKTGKKVGNPVNKVLETGKIIGLANHTTLIAKNGREYQIADSAAPIIDAHGITNGVVLVFRDVTEEYRMREKIVDSEKKYADLFNSSLSGIALHEIVLDKSGKPIDYIFLEANTAFEQLTGLPVKKIIGKKVTEVIPGIEKSPFIQKYGQVALTGKPISFEQFAPGINKYYKINAFSPGKGLFATIFVDVTDNKRAEQELKTERRRLADIIKGTNVGTWEWNVQTGETIFDDQWAQIIGYTLEELSPVSIDTWSKYVHPDDLKLSNEMLARHFNGETDFYECEVRMRHKNGHWVWILDRGRVSVWTEDKKPLLVSGTHQDITERKRNEEALQMNEAIFSSFLEHSPIYVFFKDKDIRSLRLSRNYEQLLGMPIQQALGKNMNELFPSDLAKSMVADDLRVLNDGKCVEVVEELNGRHYETTKFPIFKDGQPVMLAGFTIDITERKKTEEQIRKNLLEKEVMLKEIHHRVKNNMNVITSLLHLQSKRIQTKEQAQAAFEESRNRIFSMALVHEQLYKSDDFSKIDMKTYIESISQKLKQNSSIDKHITSELQVNNIFLEVTQAIPCGLILNELLTNIYKHAFTEKKEGRIIISFKQPVDSEYELIVRDNGRGLPENIDFNNISTLGLQLVKLLTDQIGGTLQVDRNKGASFTIRFQVTNGRA
ncbi:MAG TPA: PAS domain S-box protein [bacterium]|mgnify:CR=1 FL=1|nr:PAS domain S-box protein [bacterium]HPN43534.1 PAS domain S-box protein [bacterium]